MRPNEMLVYLVTIAAMMSVPAELPLCENVVPTPRPHSVAPMMVHMNGWSSTMPFSKSGTKMYSRTLQQVAPKMVRSTNWRPTVR